jgi:hypothetical protein
MRGMLGASLGCEITVTSSRRGVDASLKLPGVRHYEGETLLTIQGLFPVAHDA